MQLSPEKIIDKLEESNDAIDEMYEEFEAELEKVITAIDEAVAAIDEVYDKFATELEEAIATTLKVTDK